MFSDYVTALLYNQLPLQMALQYVQEVAALGGDVDALVRLVLKARVFHDDTDDDEDNDEASPG